MTRIPEGRREVSPSRKAMGEGQRPGFGPKLGVSVPISIGLPLMVIGLFCVITGVIEGGVLFVVLGGVLLAAGAALFASGRRL